MYIQLIRHLERRPEKYSAGGASNRQTLLLMDEFARFGKLPMITAAMATLRSKNVNICLMVQSVAQLDKIYGEHDRRIIFDNCQFQAILRANDADTQKYLCELVGTHICSGIVQVSRWTKSWTPQVTTGKPTKLGSGSCNPMSCQRWRRYLFCPHMDPAG